MSLLAPAEAPEVYGGEAPSKFMRNDLVQAVFLEEEKLRQQEPEAEPPAGTPPQTSSQQGEPEEEEDQAATTEDAIEQLCAQLGAKKQLPGFLRSTPRGRARWRNFRSKRPT